MSQFDESAAHLPPPRADEPANLRREILEELSDHLTCARKREQLAGGSQTEAAIQHRVLDRFGDPAAIARKLWLDWMWEKIMTQRILIGVCILLAVVTCAALAFAWVSINRQHELIAELQLTSQSQREQQQEQFERLLADSQKSKSPSDWNPVELRFVKGKEGGPPAEGIKVHVSIQATETGIPDMEGVSNAQGIVHFDRVRYGTYTVTTVNAAQEKLTTNFTLQPGQSLTRTIVCPEPPTQTAKVTARINWPEDLAKKPLWLSFQWDDIDRPVAGKKWTPSAQLFKALGRSEPFRGPLPWFAPNGDVLIAKDSSEGSRTIGGSSFSGIMFGFRTWARRGRSNVDEPIVLKKPDGIDWPGPDYVIRDAWVLVSMSGLTSADELEKSTISDAAREREDPYSRDFFYTIRVSPADWSYRLEPSQAGRPAILQLTPTVEAVEKVRAALPEFETAVAEAEASRALQEQRRAAFEESQRAASAAETKTKTDSK
ncbi:MAG: carboxypeptidase-like regulatory domain-containing protein [Pirellulales bacterium]